MSEVITLTQMPIPPSENHLYATNWKTKRRFKSEALVLYERAMQDYFWTNSGKCGIAKTMIQEWLKNGYQLQVNSYFWLFRARLYTKEGKLKRFDVSNRIKALHDQLGTLLGFDDMLIKGCQAVKGEIESGVEHTGVIIKPFQWMAPT